MSRYYEIGEILENGEIERGESYNGYIYKSLEAFLNKSGICYVPELSDNKYTYKDFLDMVNGNEELAEILFDLVDWQSPGTKLDELIADDEVNFCINCEKAYKSYMVDSCPHCGQLKVITSFKKEENDVYIFSIGEKDYTVSVNRDLMKKMNWSWESLIFADNADTFAFIETEDKIESTVLNTSGEVKVYDLSDNSLLSIDDVIKLSISGEIHDSSKYSIDSNNWFTINYRNENCLLDDDVFKAIPKDTLEVATLLLESHLNYFSI